MKKIVFILLVLSFFMQIPAGDDEPAAYFSRAHQLYENQDYSRALQLYQEVEKVLSHWLVFYNMGNCYYKLENFVRAKIYYLRAQRLNPSEPDIKKNLQVVNQHFRDRVQDQPPDFISRIILKVESVLSLNLLAFCLLLLVILLNGFIFLLATGGKRKWLLYGISFCLVFILINGGYLLHRQAKKQRHRVAVVVSEKAELRSGPGQDNTVLFQVHPGLKVRIIDQNRNWLQVSASDKIAGWIEAGQLERI
jgi:tetratricopeptide (TPR) repeat protein